MKKFLLVLSVVLSVFFVETVSANFVAVSMPKFDDNFQTVLRENIEARADQLNLIVYVGNAEDQLELQLEQIRHFVEAEADAIIVLPVLTTPDAINQMLDARGNSDIPMVFLQRLPEIDTYPEKVVYLGSDETESGSMQMEELARLAAYEGQVAILQGAEGNPASTVRTDYVREVVDKYPGMSVTLQERGNWARNQALTIVKRWLDESPEQFSIIAANNDEMALGAIMAFEQAGIDPNHYLVGGIDATRDALASVQKDLLDVTVLQDAASQGKGAIDAALAMINGREVPEKIWVPFRLVTPENIQQFVE